jgi:uncharacterized protein with LGFP repeats
MYEGSGTITANVAIPDYVFISPATLTPTPIASPTSEAPSATPVPTPSLPALLVAGAIAAAAMVKRS